MANIFYLPAGGQGLAGFRAVLAVQQAQRFVNPEISEMDMISFGGWNHPAGIYLFDDDGSFRGSIGTGFTYPPMFPRYLNQALLSASASDLNAFTNADSYIITSGLSGFDAGARNNSHPSIRIGGTPNPSAGFDGQSTVILHNGLTITAISQSAGTTTITFDNGASINFIAGATITFQLGDDDAPSLTLAEFFTEVGFADGTLADSFTVGMPTLTITGTGTVAENSTFGTVVTGIALEASGGTGEFTFHTGDATFKFYVVSDGAGGWNLAIINPLDFETEVDADPNTPGTQIIFDVTANNGDVASAPQTAVVTLTNVNDEAPTLAINARGTVVTLDTPSTENILTLKDDFVDPDSITIQARIADSGSFLPVTNTIDGIYGTLTLTRTGWRYDLDPSNEIVNALRIGDTPLTDSFEIRADDGEYQSQAQPLTITINGAAVNTPPSIRYNKSNNSRYEVMEDDFGTIGFTLIAEDDLTPLAELTIEAVVEPHATDPVGAATSGFAQVQNGSVLTGSHANWSITANNNGRIGWEIAPNSTIHALDNGETVYERLSVRLTDHRGEVSESITVVLALTGANDAPTTGDTALKATQGIAFAFQTSDFIFNDVDTGDTLQSISFAANPQGAITLGGQSYNANTAVTVGQIMAGDLVFTPTTTAPVSLDYRVNDGTEDSVNPATLAFTVQTPDANTAPIVAQAIGARAFNEGSGKAKIDLGNVFTDADNNPLILSLEGIIISAPHPPREFTDKFSINASNELVIDTIDLAIGEYTVTIQANDRNGGTTTHQFTVDIENPAPMLTLVGIDSIIDEGKAVILTDANLIATDENDAPERLIYTLEAAVNTRLEHYDAQSDLWLNIGTGGEFTQRQVNDGIIRLMPMGEAGTASISLSLADDGGASAGAVQSLSFSVRLRAEITSTEIGGGEFHIDRDSVKKAPPVDDGGATGNSGASGNSETSGQTKNDPHILVETGLGDNPITTGTGDDIIDAGLGIDAIDLSHGGDDEVIYRFKPTEGTGGFVAWDGADKITGFTIGSDVLTFASTGDNAQDGTGAIRDFVGGLGTEFKVALSFTHREGSRTALESYDVAGIDIHFPQALMLASGRITGAKLAIEFAEGIAWADFNSEYLGGEAFNMSTFLLNGNEAGRKALGDLLGASVEMDTSRGLIFGTGTADTIDASDAGEAVILGGGGDDGITLGSGGQELVYRLSDDGTAVTATDGADTINGFTLGEDSLRFVDMDGAGGVPTLAELLARPSVSVALQSNGTNYTGITLGIDGDASVAVNFTTPISQNRLSESITATELQTLFGGEYHIEVTDSLPIELI